jgi:putative transposase
MEKRYRVSDALWAVVWPLFPKRGPQQEAKQRLFFEAVVFMTRQSLAWRLLPACYGNWNSVFVQFNRYSKNGVWQRIFEAVTTRYPHELQLDSTSIKAHRHASGAPKKRGPNP